ncbi:MAG: uncharacterized protein KVP18_001465 [Porospora cf. gigantea A]|uniref:uncharacterized protein n=1 Tax=Porospora cf. gigantea A TaxID=2853593 RepID=UPI00355975B6|nr:MAG: hypothetical protein KVP18_001465 [Porospora cf. gigantea A]
MKVFVRGMFACRSNHIVIEDMQPADRVSRLLEKTIDANEDLNTQMQVVLSIKGVPLDPDASLESSGVQDMQTVHLRIVR